MRCAILTPVGPGHEALAKEAGASVLEAEARCLGPFSSVVHLTQPDPLGELGRGKARNLLLEKAHQDGADILFWLDADDLMAPDAFRGLETALAAQPDAEAVWGTIAEYRPSRTPLVRPAQIYPKSYAELIAVDPTRTLQIGYFVRTEVQRAHPWREDMNTGEDFEMYLRLWKAHKCVKSPSVFFINRRRHHSTGPRAASGGDWRRVVTAMLERARA
jgi:hypothetical protein